MISSPPQPTRNAHARARRGLALPAVLFALVLVGGIGGVMYWVADLHARAVSNRESAIRATQLAESGLNHALALVRDSMLRDTTLSRLLRGPDGTKGTTDDGILSGYGLPSAIAIPATGVTTAAGGYFVRLRDDPAEADSDSLTDRNVRLLARCHGVALDGTVVTINAVIGNPSLPALLVNGNLEISGTTRVLGRCGRAHANGLLTLGSPLVAEAGASSTSATSGTIRDVYGAILPKLEYADSIAVPDIAAAAHCGLADYHIAGGVIRNLSTGASYSPATLGWYGGPATWEAKSNVAPGTYCVDGNVKIGDSFGTATSPRALSLIVKGSLEVSGQAYMTAETPDLMWIVDGDLKLNGNSTSGTPNYRGFVHAGAQCEMSGTVRLAGQVICANRPNPAASENWVAENKVSGTTYITFACGGFLGEFWRVLAWYPTLAG